MGETVHLFETVNMKHITVWDSELKKKDEDKKGRNDKRMRRRF
jgi:hypothetical protein